MNFDIKKIIEPIEKEFNYKFKPFRLKIYPRYSNDEAIGFKWGITFEATNIITYTEGYNMSLEHFKFSICAKLIQLIEYILKEENNFKQMIEVLKKAGEK